MQLVREADRMLWVIPACSANCYRDSPTYVGGYLYDCKIYHDAVWPDAHTVGAFGLTGTIDKLSAILAY